MQDISGEMQPNVLGLLIEKKGLEVFTQEPGAMSTAHSNVCVSVWVFLNVDTYLHVQLVCALHVLCVGV